MGAILTIAFIFFIYIMVNGKSSRTGPINEPIPPPEEEQEQKEPK